MFGKEPQTLGLQNQEIFNISLAVMSAGGEELKPLLPDIFEKYK